MGALEVVAVLQGVLGLLGAARLWVAVGDYRMRRRAAARTITRLA